MTRAMRFAAAALALVGAAEVGAAAWIPAKGFVAQRLIASAWSRAKVGEAARRPWPWADMRPVARLTVLLVSLTRSFSFPNSLRNEVMTRSPERCVRT